MQGLTYTQAKAELKRSSQAMTEFHRHRYDFTLASKSPAVRDFLTYIPYTLHYNQYGMKFYVPHAPAGIKNFIPDLDLLANFADYVNTTAKFFRQSKQNKILGIYVMGSVTSVTFTADSDIDLWVVVDPSLSNIERKRLYRKLNLISEWLKEAYAIDASFYIVDSQHLLYNRHTNQRLAEGGIREKIFLLDEFYRSATKLAGQWVLWYFLPEIEGLTYEEVKQIYLDYQLINPEDWIDFGGVEVTNLSRQAFYATSLWLIYKSLQNPFKSFIKICLLEAYFSEYPNTELVSVTMKKQILSMSNSSYRSTIKYDENLYDIAGLNYSDYSRIWHQIYHSDGSSGGIIPIVSRLYFDPYELVVDKVMQYLVGQGDTERAYLVFTSFLLKVNKHFTPSLNRIMHSLKLNEAQAVEYLLMHLDVADSFINVPPDLRVMTIRLRSKYAKYISIVDVKLALRFTFWRIGDLVKFSDNYKHALVRTYLQLYSCMMQVVEEDKSMQISFADHQELAEIERTVSSLFINHRNQIKIYNIFPELNLEEQYLYFGYFEQKNQETSDFNVFVPSENSPVNNEESYLNAQAKTSSTEEDTRQEIIKDKKTSRSLAQAEQAQLELAQATELNQFEQAELGQKLGQTKTGLKQLAREEQNPLANQVATSRVNSAKSVKEENLAWYVVNINKSNPNLNPEHKHIEVKYDFISLVCWCYFNGLITNKTQLQLKQNPYYSQDFLLNLLKGLRKRKDYLRLLTKSVSDYIFIQPVENEEKEPLAEQLSSVSWQNYMEPVEKIFLTYATILAKYAPNELKTPPLDIKRNQKKLGSDLNQSLSRTKVEEIDKFNQAANFNSKEKIYFTAGYQTHLVCTPESSLQEANTPAQNRQVQGEQTQDSQSSSYRTSGNKSNANLTSGNLTNSKPTHGNNKEIQELAPKLHSERQGNKGQNTKLSQELKQKVSRPTRKLLDRINHALSPKTLGTSFNSKVSNQVTTAYEVKGSKPQFQYMRHRINVVGKLLIASAKNNPASPEDLAQKVIFQHGHFVPEARVNSRYQSTNFLSIEYAVLRDFSATLLSQDFQLKNYLPDLAQNGFTVKRLQLTLPQKAKVHPQLLALLDAQELRIFKMANLVRNNQQTKQTKATNAQPADDSFSVVNLGQAYKQPISTKEAILDSDPLSDFVPHNIYENFFSLLLVKARHGAKHLDRVLGEMLTVPAQTLPSLMEAHVKTPSKPKLAEAGVAPATQLLLEQPGKADWGSYIYQQVKNEQGYLEIRVKKQIDALLAVRRLKIWGRQPTSKIQNLSQGYRYNLNLEGIYNYLLALLEEPQVFVHAIPQALTVPQALTEQNQKQKQKQNKNQEEQEQKQLENTQTAIWLTTTFSLPQVALSYHFSPTWQASTTKVQAKIAYTLPAVKSLKWFNYPPSLLHQVLDNFRRQPLLYRSYINYLGNLYYAWVKLRVSNKTQSRVYHQNLRYLSEDNLLLELGDKLNLDLNNKLTLDFMRKANAIPQVLPNFAGSGYNLQEVSVKLTPSQSLELNQDAIFKNLWQNAEARKPQEAPNTANSDLYLNMFNNDSRPLIVDDNFNFKEETNYSYTQPLVRFKHLANHERKVVELNANGEHRVFISPPLPEKELLKGGFTTVLTSELAYAEQLHNYYRTELNNSLSRNRRLEVANHLLGYLKTRTPSKETSTENLAPVVSTITHLSRIFSHASLKDEEKIVRAYIFVKYYNHISPEDFTSLKSTLLELDINISAVAQDLVEYFSLVYVTKVGTYRNIRFKGVKAFANLLQYMQSHLGKKIPSFRVRKLNASNVSYINALFTKTIKYHLNNLKQSNSPDFTSLRAEFKQSYKVTSYIAPYSLRNYQVTDPILAFIQAKSKAGVMQIFINSNLATNSYDLYLSSAEQELHIYLGAKGNLKRMLPACLWTVCPQISKSLLLLEVYFVEQDQDKQYTLIKVPEWSKVIPLS
ncbi:hypothetical protein CKF54_01170 [Psittacicella hinzii]|uniref:Adenylate cyclase class-I N-terminal domain-containing protein n=1 Tax=Psittacicella hinzii TaxID=2028575 RepID=A0A3A1YAH2_9GAMM|nr:class I adenylate cyclase [Psittacicella hinzii]RIY34229.1 hypothetical protein CKF54_01170 [Psittacicella hinzii]